MPNAINIILYAITDVQLDELLTNYPRSGEPAFQALRIHNRAQANFKFAR